MLYVYSMVQNCGSNNKKNRGSPVQKELYICFYDAKSLKKYSLLEQDLDVFSLILSGRVMVVINWALVILLTL